MESNKLFVGIDVSKNNLDIAITTDSESILTSFKVTNNQKGYEKLVKLAEGLGVKQNCNNIHFCFESTGIYSFALFEYLNLRNFAASMINPTSIKSFANALNVRTKTDKVDAKVIALYAVKFNPAKTVLKPDNLRKLTAITRRIEFLKKQLIREKTFLETVKYPEIAYSVNEAIESYEENLLQLKEELNLIFAESESLKKNKKLLTSIIGIGEASATILLCELVSQNNPDEKFDIKVQTAHAGLAPCVKQSGSSLNRKTGISKKGNKRLRSILYMPTLCAIKTNPVVREFYLRLKKKNKPGKVCITACMRKLLSICIGVLNNQKTFDPDYSKTL